MKSQTDKNSETPRSLGDPAEATSQHTDEDPSAPGPEEADFVPTQETPLRKQIAANAVFIQQMSELNQRHGLDQLERAFLQFERAVLQQLKFEKFLFDLSRTFISLPEEQVDVNMERGLADVGKFLQMDRVTLFEVSPTRTELSLAYSWSAPGAQAPAPAITDHAQPWWVRQVLRGEVTLASRVDDLPEEAGAEKAYLRERGVASAASIPLNVAGEIAGAISFITTRRHVSWTDDLVDQLRAIADILWNALKRLQARQSLLVARASVRDSDERFRLAMNNVVAGVYMLDLNGVVTYVNPAAEAMFGWTNAELLGKKMHDVTHYLHPDGTPFPANECPGLQVLQQDVELREHQDTFIRKDGRFFPVVFSASPLRKDGTTVGIVVGFRDDTVRREAERAIRESEALRASEERYRGLADQSVDGVVLADRTARFLDGNQAACHLFGCTLEDLKTLRLDDMLTAEEHDALAGHLQRLANGEVVRNEWHFKRKDGSVFLGEAIGRQLPDGRLQVVVRDITEHKRIEQARAEDARMKDEFLAFLGHELRNPLAAIHTAVQVLSKGAPPVRRAKMEHIIDQQTVLMRRLVDDLLDLERITHGHIELKKERQDLAESLHRAVAPLQSTIASRRQELSVRLPGEPVRFMADPVRLDQIVGNLLSNASKYSRTGGRIELSGAQEGSNVIIRCKDNGQGILPEYQQKIFEPFVRGRRTDSGYGEASLGLGLALVKQLTELHGGTVSVDSAGAGQGSEFTVRLPLVAPSVQTAVHEPQPAGSSHRGRRVVIVEDNPSVGEALQVALEQAGHSVELFADGPSTLASVPLLEPDAFLIDIGLPGMDGYELAATLKQRSDTQEALRIAVSGMKRRERAGDAPDAFDYYFNKPVDVSELLASLEHGRPTRCSAGHEEHFSKR